MLHLGESSLDDHSIALHSDTLFSALAIEAWKMGGNAELDSFVGLARNGELSISDAFPFVGSSYFIPKPMMPVIQGNAAERTERSSAQKKAMKNIAYIRESDLGDFLNGRLDAASVADILDKIGDSSVHTKAAVRTGGDTLPYHVGVFGFRKNAGLYFFAMCSDAASEMLERLLDGLSESGVGGKRSSGFGRFSWRKDADSESAKNMMARLAGIYERYMTLGVALPMDGEMDSVLSGATYALLKRSGFVASDSFTGGEPVRKKDLYAFSPGAVVEQKFKGDIYDVGQGGAHPVYRYAMPMFLGIGQEVG
jgi:CRISPR-associated protein Csm4